MQIFAMTVFDFWYDQIFSFRRGDGQTVH